jgi:lipopolysaccharide transport system ATP-binding protein
MSVIIEVENLGKKYKISHEENVMYSSIRNELTKSVKSIFSSNKKKTVEEFWALKNISFQLKEGERIGIIGKNGAGKSTLLKMLSRVVFPTEGKIFLNGQIASLLEVGTGFHPELTGRENIFLNGVLLGMRKKEIEKKFDEIVSFSEVENFLDTPVKRYSSGMFVKLAFSVAAHMEPDVLIIDEVLSVGDAAFQKKSIAKMQEISNKEGRTILFVSHNMDALQTLCPTSIYLKNGQMQAVGNTLEIIKNYLQN